MEKQHKTYIAPALTVTRMEPLCVMNNFSQTQSTDKTGGNTETPGIGDFTRKKRASLWDQD